MLSSDQKMALYHRLWLGFHCSAEGVCEPLITIRLCCVLTFAEHTSKVAVFVCYSSSFYLNRTSGLLANFYTNSMGKKIVKKKKKTYNVVEQE